MADAGALSPKLDNSRETENPWAADLGQGISLRCTFTECKKLTDATLVSKDGDTFGVHSEYIRLASSNLLPQDSLEPALIRMESSTQVVALLLEYLHLGRPLPHTEKIEHNVFMELAEAASKYDIYVAIEVIKLRMSLLEYELHPFHVLKFAAKQKDNVLLDKAARKALTGRYPIPTQSELTPELSAVWSSYSKPYVNTLVSVMKANPYPAPHFRGQGCRVWKRYVGLIKVEASKWLRDERLVDAPNFIDRMVEITQDMANECPAGSCNKGAVKSWWHRATGGNYPNDTASFSELLLRLENRKSDSGST